MSNQNIPISLEIKLDDQVCQFDLFMAFDIAFKSHVANPQVIESRNISIRAPSSSHTNQELATFGATISSRGSKVVILSC